MENMKKKNEEDATKESERRWKFIVNTKETCSRRKMLIIEEFNRRRLLVDETFSTVGEYSRWDTL